MGQRLRFAMHTLTQCWPSDVRSVGVKLLQFN